MSFSRLVGEPRNISPLQIDAHDLGDQLLKRMTSMAANVPELANISLQPEIRAAKLYTEFEIGGTQFSFTALGARSCAVLSSEVDEKRSTLSYNLACSLTWFETEHDELGAIRIFQDPRIENKGWIYVRQDQSGNYSTPALSYFNQHLVFHIGDEYLFYPRAWQVVSSITQWPPEYHQYHHLEERTPVFDLLTRRPNVAIKGISTISILGPLEPDEEARIRAECQAEIDKFNFLPATMMTPEDLTPLQATWD